MPKRRPAVTITQLIKALKVEKCVVYRWVRKGHLPVMRLRSYHKKGNYIVKREDAVWLVSNWRRTCTPTEAGRLLGVCEKSAWYFITKGIFRSVKVCGLNRVFLDSIPGAKEFIGKDVVNPGLIGFARYSPEKIRELARLGQNHYQLTLADRQKGARRMNEVLKENGKAHRWTHNSEEARDASRKGVQSRKNKLEKVEDVVESPA